MKNVQTLDQEGFFEMLEALSDEIWTATIEKDCLHLRRAGSEITYSPLTAVYWHLTGAELHRGSFFHPEITKRFHFPWYDILEIVYAEICCVANGKHYSSRLRLRMLHAVAPLIRQDSLKEYLEHLARETLKVSYRAP